MSATAQPTTEPLPTAAEWADYQARLGRAEQELAQLRAWRATAAAGSDLTVTPTANGVIFGSRPP